jgi:hypothetical protein
MGISGAVPELYSGLLTAPHGAAAGVGCQTTERFGFPHFTAMSLAQTESESSTPHLTALPRPFPNQRGLVGGYRVRAGAGGGIHVGRDMRLIHLAQYSEKDHVACEAEASFWRGDGCVTRIEYRGDVWLLYVYEL